MAKKMASDVAAYARTLATQRKAARLAGLLYLVAMATGLFAEFYVHFPTALVVAGDPVATAHSWSSSAYDQQAWSPTSKACAGSDRVAGLMRT